MAGPPPPPPGANRSDLQNKGAPPPTPGALGQPNGQPITVPSGLKYGENQMLAQAQAAVPLGGGNGALPPAPPQGATAAPQGPPPQGPGMPQAMPPDAAEAARQYQMPQLGLMAPTARPGEHVTAGLPGTPGAPSQLAVSNNGIGAMLARMATMANSPALSQLAARANALQQ